MIVIGTRPEAIKMAPLIIELKNRSHLFDTIICTTGQHKQMLDQVFKIFNIHPDIKLNIMKANQEPINVVNLILFKIQKILKTNKPDLVLVHGDTSTTFSTALACFYLGISIGHVEAGLRTNNLYSPFPEEFNRQVVSRIANLHFAPTEQCKLNLLKECINFKKIFVTGNTVVDALFWSLKRIDFELKTNPKFKDEIYNLIKLDLSNIRYILITGHRRENFGKGFEEICNAILKLSKIYQNVHFIYPVHLNPKVRYVVKSKLNGIFNIHLIEPVDYLKFIYLLKNCYFILTDSGGIQEEAPSLGKPVILIRENTERIEALKSGTAEIVGPNCNQIVNSVSKLLSNKSLYKKMTKKFNPFGDGRAVKRIVRVLGSMHRKKNEKIK